MAAFATTLDAFHEGRPRAPTDLRVDVEEVTAASALTDCGLPGTPYSLNPYVGCAHACAYCYVPTVTHVDQGQWGGWVRPKRNVVNLLAREVRRREPGLVFMSSATDPYQPVESRYRLTRRCLEVLAREDWPLRLLTRSPLALRDVDVLERFTRLTVGFSVPTLDDGFRRVLEPGAPPIKGRLAALKALSDAGFDTYAMLAPTYPLTGGWTPRAVARAFADAGVRRVIAGAWRYEEKAAPHARRLLEGTPYEGHAGGLFDRRAFNRLAAELERAFRGAGVEFSAYR